MIFTTLYNAPLWPQVLAYSLTGCCNRATSNSKVKALEENHNPHSASILSSILNSSPLLRLQLDGTVSSKFDSSRLDGWSAGLAAVAGIPYFGGLEGDSAGIAIGTIRRCLRGRKGELAGITGGVLGWQFSVLEDGLVDIVVDTLELCFSEPAIKLPEIDTGFTWSCCCALTGDLAGAATGIPWRQLSELEGVFSEVEMFRRLFEPFALESPWVVRGLTRCDSEGEPTGFAGGVAWRLLSELVGEESAAADKHL